MSGLILRLQVKIPKLIKFEFSYNSVILKLSVLLLLLSITITIIDIYFLAWCAFFFI